MGDYFTVTVFAGELDGVHNDHIEMSGTGKFSNQYCAMVLMKLVNG